MGVGIDLLEIERLERALARRPRLAERLFTDAERAYAATRARPVMHLAARFCAKEAVAPERAIPMVLRPGQLMVFDCQTLHGSSHNPSPWRRLGLACRYTSADVRVYPGQKVDGQGYALDHFGCVLVSGEDRWGHNVMCQPPRRRDAS